MLHVFKLNPNTQSCDLISSLPMQRSADVLLPCHNIRLSLCPLSPPCPTPTNKVTHCNLSSQHPPTGPDRPSLGDPAHPSSSSHSLKQSDSVPKPSPPHTYLYLFPILPTLQSLSLPAPFTTRTKAPIS